MRLIDADELDIYDVSPAYGMCVMGVTQEDIDDAPTVDAEPVKHGMWLPLTMSEATGYDPTLSGDDPVMTHYCSYCSTECYADENGEDILSAYCPRCGAKMDERTEE